MFWTVVFEIPLDCREIKPVNPKGNQPWIFTGRIDAEAEAPILWPPDEKSRLIGKDLYGGKDWRQEEKGMTEDKMAGWIWIWVNSRSWWWTGKPGVLQSLGLQTVRRLSNWIKLRLRRPLDSRDLDFFSRTTEAPEGLSRIMTGEKHVLGIWSDF